MAERLGGGRVEGVTIAVCTYRRNDLLQSVLPLLLAQGDGLDRGMYAAEVLVVDNNPDGDAAAVVATLQLGRGRGAATELRYVHQPRPGLSAARNAVLGAARGRWLAFIDDDEEPGESWLTELLAAAHEYGAAGVAGPILVRYEAPPPDWIVQGRFFERARFPTGTLRPAGPTSNLLLDLDFVHRHELSFREEFGMAGGEDTMFTTEMVSLGGLIVWCDEAPVTDLVPVDRMTREWVLNRRFRFGNSHSRILLTLQPAGLPRLALRVRLVLGGTGRMVLGLLQRLRGAVTGSAAVGARGLIMYYRGAGMAAGALGRRFAEYERAPLEAAEPAAASRYAE